MCRYSKIIIAFFLLAFSNQTRILEGLPLNPAPTPSTPTAATTQTNYTLNNVALPFGLNFSGFLYIDSIDYLDSPQNNIVYFPLNSAFDRSDIKVGIIKNTAGALGACKFKNGTTNQTVNFTSGTLYISGLNKSSTCQNFNQYQCNYINITTPSNNSVQCQWKDGKCNSASTIIKIAFAVLSFVFLILF